MILLAKQEKDQSLLEVFQEEEIKMRVFLKESKELIRLDQGVYHTAGEQVQVKNQVLVILQKLSHLKEVEEELILGMLMIASMNRVSLVI